MAELTLDGGPLAIVDVVAVARDGAEVHLSSEAAARMDTTRQIIEDVVADGETVYGVTTGFGALAGVRVPDEDLEQLQRSLLRSHASGVGPPLPAEVVRAMMLLRARTLATGYSGVRPLLATRLLRFLNARVHPIIPEQGSVGASGDLAQLAHLALPLIGEGWADIAGDTLDGAAALQSMGLEPLNLRPKEGLSLLNGTEAMLAVGCLAQADAEKLAVAADVISAMSLEAVLGTDRTFDPRLHEIRPHPGQQKSAANLLRILSGSKIVSSHRESDHAVQDAYSMRCTPHVHGAARDVIYFARGVFERELASVTDNPVVLADTREVLSTGNFHGEPLGFALDFLASALSEFGSISERRTDRMLDPNHSSGLPAFLAHEPGLNSGFMLSQYTQAALVAQNRILSHPATVDTIPTSGSQEDHVSMGWNAALKLRSVVFNVSRILAVEALCAAQALEMRAPLRPAEATAAAIDAIRQIVAHLDSDRVLGPEIEAVAEEVLLSGVLSDRVARVTGELA